jgi:hypothetical protein
MRVIRVMGVGGRDPSDAVRGRGAKRTLLHPAGGGAPRGHQKRRARANAKRTLCHTQRRKTDTHLCPSAPRTHTSAQIHARRARTCATHGRATQGDERARAASVVPLSPLFPSQRQEAPLSADEGKIQSLGAAVAPPRVAAGTPTRKSMDKLRTVPLPPKEVRRRWRCGARGTKRPAFETWLSLCVSAPPPFLRTRARQAHPPLFSPPHTPTHTLDMHAGRRTQAQR